MKRAKLLPPIHPGEILSEEFLKPLGMSMNQLAEELHVPANRITQVVQGRRGITGETALRLARYFGTSAEFWLGMQKDFDLQVARDQFEAEVARQVRAARQGGLTSHHKAAIDADDLAGHRAGSIRGKKRRHRTEFIGLHDALLDVVVLRIFSLPQRSLRTSRRACSSRPAWCWSIRGRAHSH